MLLKFLSAFLLCASAGWAYVVNNGTTCYVYPESLVYGGQPIDDTPSILQAFDLCGINGSVIFTENTFYVDQVMNTTNLLNCNIDIYGTLIWSTNIPYWLSHSISVVYQDQSTAWLFGGVNVSLQGHGHGKFDGNGQRWYDENMNNSNQPGRPITITFYNSTNLFVDGLTWSQAQFWHSFISHSANVTMSNIFMNSTSNNGNGTVNTDGTDTWNSANVNLQNWTVQNGDDCIAIKGNSSNIYVNNITCHGSGGMPIGSIGQYPSTPDYIENILFENVNLFDSSSAAWIKTWPGVNVPTSGNGDAGGGGTGFVRNVTWRDFRISNVDQPIYVTQCIYNGDPSICDTSKLQLSQITWHNIIGTSRYNIASSIHCSAAAPCPGIKFIDVDITPLDASKSSGSAAVEIYQCANIVGGNGTGIPCNRYAPGDWPQQVGGDV